MKPNHEAGLCLLEKPRCWSNHFDGNAFCPMCQGGCWRKQVAGGALVHDGSGSFQLGSSTAGHLISRTRPHHRFSRLLVRKSNTMPTITYQRHRKPCMFFGKFDAREHFARSSDGRPRMWQAFARESRHTFCTTFFCVKAARFLSQDHQTHRAHLTAPSISTMTISIYCCVHVGTTGAICKICKVESVQNKNAPSESRVLKSVRIDEII